MRLAAVAVEDVRYSVTVERKAETSALRADEKRLPASFFSAFIFACFPSADAEDDSVEDLLVMLDE